MASTSIPATSPSYSPPEWVHDVFLSFRGKDTRNTFTSHLYANLKQRGIDVYMDDRELERGSPIDASLSKAIAQSRFSVVIFSRDYASSPWCLDELVKIVQCMKEMGHTVLPVFYDVDPSVVAERKWIYEKSFIEHEQNYRENLEKVQIWKDCLATVSNLSGWDVRNRNESETVKRVVEYIAFKLGVTLPTISKNLVGIDIRLEVLGEEIVRCESPEEPGRRSRLWTFKDVQHALMNTSTRKEKVEIIFLDMPRTKEAQWNMKAFSKLSKLRLLKIHNVQFSEGPEHLSNELRLLEWHAYPSKSLPANFKPDELVELDLSYSNIQQLWSGFKRSINLKIINLSHSLYLTRSPDFTGIPNIERLILEGCTSLSEVHPSFALHKKLQYVNLANCRSLRSLPSDLEMESLRVCILEGCSKLENFPDIEGSMDCLMELRLDETIITELSSSMCHLVGLVVLSMVNCKNLEIIPNSINMLKSLKKLDLSGCSELKSLPEDLGKVESLEELDISGTSIRQPPASICLLKNLIALSFSGCKITALIPMDRVVLSLSDLYSLEILDLCACNLGEGSVPEDIGRLSSLRFLDLSRNSFFSLPTSINKLSRLEVLNLEGCRMLKSLPEAPSKVQKVNLNGCIYLRQVPDPILLCSLKRSWFHCLNCWELDSHNGHMNLGLTMLKKYIQGPSHIRPGFSVALPGSKIPGWFSHQSDGSSISMQVHPKLDGTYSLPIGFAACVAFSVSDESLHLFCHLKASATENYPLPMYISCNAIQVLSDHLWLFYLSFDHLKEIDEWKHESFSNIELSFHFHEEGVKVKNCGVRLVYSLSNSSSSSCHLIVATKSRATSSSIALSSFSSYFCKATSLSIDLSSFSSYFYKWMRSVSLSVRTKDTCCGFTSYLYTALVPRGISWAAINPDGEKEIDPRLMEAIEESRLAVMIYTSNNDYISWCINEILRIIQYANNRIIDADLPVSYDIESLNSDGPKGSCAIVFDKDQDDSREKRENVDRWSKILTMVTNSPLGPQKRSYYRCNSPGCEAKRSVQRIQGNPEMYEMTYSGHHTCVNDKMPSINTLIIDE